MKTIDIICPIYNGDKYIKDLNESILRQTNVSINSVLYILSESNDSSEDVLKSLGCKYEKIKKEEFSHSLTREKYAKKSKGDIIVFISQDIIIENDDWLHNLTKDILEGKCEAAYSRQLSKKNNIEKYTREHNYPNNSFIKDKKDIESMGLNTFFFSDASSAIDRSVFEKLNYYDGKNLASNEDQYIAYKLIMNDYRIKYCADSIVYHSHDFNFKSLYRRYRDTGLFYKQESYMNKFGTNKEGFKLAKYILKRIFEDKNYKALLEYIPNMLARFLGMKL